METLFLDLSRRMSLANFISHWSSFASKDLRKQVDTLVRRYDDGEDVEKNLMAEAAKDLAREIWPVRYALDRFFAGEGALVEWDRVEHAVGKSTAHLMDRFRQATDVKSVDDLLAHDDFDMSFHDEGREEIVTTRHHVREDYWQSQSNTLEHLVEEGTGLLETFERHIKDMRLLAERLPMAMQEELYGKVTKYEDKWLFKGETIPMEMLEEEMAYYRDQASEPVEDVKEGEGLGSEK
jgi:hypothetical protein